MRRAMAALAGLVVLGVVASMTVASAERRPVAENAWGFRLSQSDRVSSAARAGFPDGDFRIVVISPNAATVARDIDLPPRGFSQGDRLVVFSPLFRAGKRVGRLDVDGVWTNVNFEGGRAALVITATATLPQGQISTTGVASGTAPFFKAAITGGTGRYDTVGGDVLVRFLPRVVRLVFDVDNLG
jgi:hypothetical protein